MYRCVLFITNKRPGLFHIPRRGPWRRRDDIREDFEEIDIILSHSTVGGCVLYSLDNTRLQIGLAPAGLAGPLAYLLG